MLLDEFQAAIERLEKHNFDPTIDGPGGGSLEEDVRRRLIHLAEGLETIHWKGLHQSRAAELAIRARASAATIVSAERGVRKEWTKGGKEYRTYGGNDRGAAE